MRLKKPEDAIECYQSFHTKLKEMKHSNTNDYGNTLLKWQEVNDTVRKFLAKDSLLIVDTNWKVRCILIEKSSIHNLLQNSISLKYSFILSHFFVFP